MVISAFNSSGLTSLANFKILDLSLVKGKYTIVVKSMACGHILAMIYRYHGQVIFTYNFYKSKIPH